MFYSPSTNGFYVTGIHASMPSDVIGITTEQHAQLMLEQSIGKRIQADANGFPVAVTVTVVPVAPANITMRQARLALLQAGLLDAVEVGVATMPRESQIEWEFAATVDRTSPLVSALAAALGLNGAALDALFSSGAEL